MVEGLERYMELGLNWGGAELVGQIGNDRLGGQEVALLGLSLNFLSHAGPVPTPKLSCWVRLFSGLLVRNSKAWWLLVGWKRLNDSPPYR